MTVTSQVAKVTASGNGSATVFSFSPIVIFDNTDIEVIARTAAGAETTLSEGTGATNYSISVPSYPGTGSITYPASGGTPLPIGDTITVKRVLVIQQTVDLENQGGYFPDVQETEFDYLTMIDLQQQELIDRSFKGAVTDPITVNNTLPSVALRTNQVLGFDANGNVALYNPNTPLTPPNVPFISATQYGISQTGTASANLTALQNALNAGALAGLPVILIGGTYLMAAGLTIDAAKTRLFMERSILDFTAQTAPSGNLITITSSATDPNLMGGQQRLPVLEGGIMLFPDASHQVTCIGFTPNTLVGDPWMWGYCFRDLSLFGGWRQIALGAGNIDMVFDRVMSGSIGNDTFTFVYIGPGANAGESIQFRDCHAVNFKGPMLDDYDGSSGSNQASGDLYWRGGTIVPAAGCAARIYGLQARFSNVHIEMDGTSGDTATLFNLAGGVDSGMWFDNCEFILPGRSTHPYFYSYASSLNGISISDCSFRGDWMTTSYLRDLHCEGGGPLRVVNCHPEFNANRHFIGEGNSVIPDPHFTGSLNSSWTTNGTVAIDTTTGPVRNDGTGITDTHSLKLSSVNANALITMPCEAGQYGYLQCYLKTSVVSAGGTARITLLYLDGGGNVLAQYNLFDATDHGFQLVELISQNHPAPPGTRTIEIGPVLLVGGSMWVGSFLAMKA